jgi:hypothetical protein
MANQPTVEAMVLVFKRYTERVEKKAVHWINENVPRMDIRTQADRVGQANIGSYRLTLVAIVIAVVSLGISVIAILK